MRLFIVTLLLAISYAQTESVVDPSTITDACQCKELFEADGYGWSSDGGGSCQYGSTTNCWECWMDHCLQGDCSIRCAYDPDRTCQCNDLCLPPEEGGMYDNCCDNYGPMCRDIVVEEDPNIDAVHDCYVITYQNAWMKHPTGNFHCDHENECCTFAEAVENCNAVNGCTGITLDQRDGQDCYDMRVSTQFNHYDGPKVVNSWMKSDCAPEPTDCEWIGGNYLYEKNNRISYVDMHQNGCSGVSSDRWAFVVTGSHIVISGRGVEGTYSHTGLGQIDFPGLEYNRYTISPTQTPTLSPSKSPSLGPSIHPTNVPTRSPTGYPTKKPTADPTCIPSNAPTLVPSFSPSNVPTLAPSNAPTLAPSFSPSRNPSHMPSLRPTASPTILPTSVPSLLPTRKPSHGPSIIPTNTPTKSPSSAPTHKPSTGSPSTAPSKSSAPTFEPTMTPTKSPSSYPTSEPTTPIPTKNPTRNRGVLSLKFAAPFATTVGDRKDEFLSKCTSSMSANGIECYDVYEGSTIVTFVGEPDDVTATGAEIISNGTLNVADFDGLPIHDVPVVETMESVLANMAAEEEASYTLIKEIESSSFGVPEIDPYLPDVSKSSEDSRESMSDGEITLILLCIFAAVALMLLIAWLAESKRLEKAATKTKKEDPTPWLWRENLGAGTSV